jgi:integrase
MKVVFEWAKAKGYRTGDNPVDGVSKVLPKHNTKQAHHPALPHAEMAVFIEKLRAYEGACTRLAFEFLILTAARTSEVLLAKWSEIDLEGQVWTVPADRMKAKVEHRVPLSERCVEILTGAKQLTGGGEFAFPGSKPKKPLSNMTFEKALRLMGYDHITTHGFRSTFRDWAEEKTSFPSSVIEAALAHTVKNKVEAAYLRTKLFDKRAKLMDAWAQFVTSSPAKVLRIRA